MDKLIVGESYLREMYDSRKQIFRVSKELDISDKAGLYLADVLEYEGFELISIKFETAIECPVSLMREKRYSNVPNAVFFGALKSASEIISEYAQKLPL